MIMAIGNCKNSSLKPEKQMKLSYSGVTVAPIIKIAYLPITNINISKAKVFKVESGHLGICR